jgi:hypothetical protein
MLNLKVLACGLAISSLSLVAVAQPATGDKPATKQPGDKKPDAQQGERPVRGPGAGGGMRGMEPLAPEKAKAAWDLEANTVATRLGLSADQTKSLVTAYEGARTTQTAAVEKLRKEQADKMEKLRDGDRQDRQDAMQSMRKAMEDLNKTNKENLTKAVTTAVPGDSGTKAAAALASYNQISDRMVDTVSGFKLDNTKQQNVLKAIEDFSSEQAKNVGGNPDDRQERQEAMQAARDKFNAAVKKDLTDEQVKKLEESMPGGGRGMGGGGGGGRNRGNDGEKPKDK